MENLQARILEWVAMPSPKAPGLLLKVKEISLTTHAQKGSLEVEKGGDITSQ